MSRTYAHVPPRVETARNRDASILHIAHQHWVSGLGVVECTNPAAGCHPVLPDWASSQPRTRRSTWRAERRAQVRDRLRAASREYRTTGDVSVDVMPDPLRHCNHMCCS